MTVIAKTSSHLRTERRHEPASRTDDLLIAHLWPKSDSNLGTTLRTCDAVGATLVVPTGDAATKALRRGNTIGLHNSPVEVINDPPLLWLLDKTATHRVVGVELAHGAIPLASLKPSTEPTLVIVGHETSGIPQTALSLCHEVVEIPMQGLGNSLNVSVAAALVLYKLRGWS